MNEQKHSSPLKLAAIAAAVGIAFLMFAGGGMAAEKAVKLPPAAFDPPAAAAAAPSTAVFAGGCFWGVQAVFQHTRGVTNAVSGYSGGAKDTAHYDMIGRGTTGHAESVQVTFDPKQVSYAKLLQIYFSVAHDPTQLNRQGPDSGTQYRSAVFFADPAQKQVAERYVAQLDAAHAYPQKIVTQIVPLTAFYPAETYHQDYATLHPESPYIATFDLPKIANLKSVMPEVFRDKPVLVAAKL